MPSLPRSAAGTATGATARSSSFWRTARGRSGRPSAIGSRRIFADLVGQVLNAPASDLFEALEVGVPTYVVDLIAAAIQQPASFVMDMVGISPRAFRRREQANEPLPEVAGHRLMGFLRLAATVQQMLDESGDPEALPSFDLGEWLGNWLQQTQPQLGGRTPAQMLRNPEGLRVLEQGIQRKQAGVYV